MKYLFLLLLASCIPPQNPHKIFPVRAPFEYVIYTQEIYSNEELQEVAQNHCHGPVRAVEVQNLTKFKLYYFQCVVGR